MANRAFRKDLAGVLLSIALMTTGALVLAPPSLAQDQTQHSEELTRKVKTKVPAVYPDIARRMNITGTVKVMVVVSPNGSVKNAKVVGGHPLLVNAATEALKKWKFEPAAEESSGVVEFRFQPGN